MYRSTPHSATGVSLHAAMHGGREMRTVLPLIAPVNQVVDRSRDHHYKAKMINGLPTHTFRVGDTVIAKQKKVNKLTPTFNPTPLRIIEVQGSRVTAREIDGTRTVTRDVSYFRKIRYDVLADDEDDEDAASDSTEGATENENEDTDTPHKAKQQLGGDEDFEKAQRPQRAIRVPSYQKDYDI